MLKFNNGRGAIICDKCNYMIVDDCSMMTRKVFIKQSKKKRYCGECIRKRLKRDNEKSKENMD